MKIILAPDLFKGSLAAHEVCRAMVAGVQKVLPDAELVLIPMADGGEGTVQALVAVILFGLDLLCDAIRARG